MKKIALLFIFAFCGFLLSNCQKELDCINFKSLTEEEMYKITYEYLKYSNGQYELLLSIEEAKELGVSEFIYEEMMNYLQAANVEVAKIVMENPNVQFYNPNEAEAAIFEEMPLLKTRSETWDYVTSGNMSGQNPVSCSLYIPSGYTHMRVNLYSNAIMGTGVVTLKTPYGTETLGTWNFLFWNRSANFQLAVSSGMNVTVIMQVASSGGGTYGVNFGY